MYSEGLSHRDEKVRRSAATLYLWVLSPLAGSEDSIYPLAMYEHLKLSAATLVDFDALPKYFKFLWIPSAQRSILRITAEREAAQIVDQPTKDAILNEYLVMVLKGGYYDARCRSGFLELGRLLGTTPHMIYMREYVVAYDLHKKKEAKVLGNGHDLENTGSSYRVWKIAGAAVGGGLLMAITMGITAPALIPAIGGLFSATATGAATVGMTSVASGIGLTGSLFVASVTPAVVVTLFAGAGAGLAGYKVSVRTGSISEMEFKRLVFDTLELAVLPPPSLPPDVPLNPSDSNLHITVCIAGWTLSAEAMTNSAGTTSATSTSMDAHELLWRQSLKHHYVSSLSEIYFVKWESKHLEQFGDLLSQTITTTIAKYGVGFWAVTASKLLVAVYATIVWPYWLLWTADLIDSSFSIAIDRAEKAGVLLADALMHKAHGNRPVSLVAFSTGTVMINSCLRELKKREAYGVIDNVFLFGSALSIDVDEWASHRTIVSGRFVNGYSINDWFLAFLFRTTKLVVGLAGLQPVHVSGIENVDLSSLVDSHLAYIHKLGDLLAYVEQPHDLYVEVAYEPEKLVFQFQSSGVVLGGSNVHERPTSHERNMALEQ